MQNRWMASIAGIAVVSLALQAGCSRPWCAPPTMSVLSAPFAPSHIHDLKLTSKGELIVTGRAATNSYLSKWVVRRLFAGNWITDDEFRLPGGNKAEALSVLEQGGLYVLGSSLDSDHKQHWIVRYRASGSSTWETLDDFLPDSGSATPSRLVRASDGKILALGASGDRSDQIQWLVRELQDDRTWKTVDDFQASGLSPVLKTLSAADGTVYMSGTNSRTAESVLRRRLAGSSTWETFAFNFSGLTEGWQPLALREAPDGSLFWAFRNWATIQLSDPLWTVMKSVDQGKTWTEFSTFGNVSDLYRAHMYQGMEISPLNGLVLFGYQVVSEGYALSARRTSPPSIAAWSVSAGDWPSDGQHAEALLYGPSNQVFLGTAGSDTKTRRWNVFGSWNAGATWSSLDTYYPSTESEPDYGYGCYDSNKGIY